MSRGLIALEGAGVGVLTGLVEVPWAFMAAFTVAAVVGRVARIDAD